MKESSYKSYDDLPRIGNRMVVPKEQFIQWVNERVGGGV